MSARARADAAPLALDAIDRALIDALQEGIEVCERPFAALAARLAIDEDRIVARLRHLVDGGVLSRFGPLWNAEGLGGAVTLAAMQVPASDVDRVAAILDALPEVAHNYERDHAFNLWFVISVVEAEGIAATIRRIEAATGCRVTPFPKEREYFVGLRLAA